MEQTIALLIDSTLPPLSAEVEVNYHPLLAYGIAAITACEEIADIYVWTRSTHVAELASAYGVKRENIYVSEAESFNADRVWKGLPETDLRLELDLAAPLIDHKDLKRGIDEVVKKGSRHVQYIGRKEQEVLLSVYDPSFQGEASHASLSHEHTLRLQHESDILVAEALIRGGYAENRPRRIETPYVIERAGNKGKPKVLFCAPYAFFREDLRTELETSYDITYAFNAPRHEVEALLPGQEIWITGTCPPYLMDKDMIAKGDSLRIMATPSTGTNHLDVAFAENQGIQVISIKASPVIEQIYASSEFSFTLLLAMVNKLTPSTFAAQYGVWRDREHEFRSLELHGMTLGLIGFGRIGRKMARFAESFGMKIIAFDPYVTIDAPYVDAVDSLDILLSTADIVGLHVHLNDETRGYFGAEKFARMKPGAFFLNTARGEIVDEQAMLDALDSGHLAAAAVDVITDEHEWNKFDHPVVAYARTHDSLLVSPHIAGCTIDSESKAMKDLLGQVAFVWKNALVKP